MDTSDKQGDSRTRVEKTSDTKMKFANLKVKLI
jgi:hypothetical protein